MQNSPILKVDRVSKAYRSGAHQVNVLKQVSFNVEAASTCAILGPSGSGKTTLLSLCAGLDLPTSGSITIAGHPLHTLDEDARARLRNQMVGFVFQNFQLVPTLTALENVMVPLELRGDRRARARAADLLKQVGLSERLTHFPSQLSGGEQQRVALARAFINQPRLLFADEPTGNLDAETGAVIADLLFDLNQSFGTALVLVTHDTELARRVQRVIRLKAGALASDEITEAHEWQR